MERRNPFCPGVAVCILILALGHIAIAQYAGGTGTPDDPYLITTSEQMNAIGADPNNWDKHFKLMADIDLSEYTGTEFNIIGSAFQTGRRDTRLEQGFTGIFDGNGHTISHFVCVGNGESYVGLFRYVNDPNAEIRNLGLTAPEIDAENGYSVGGLVGCLEMGTVVDCYVIEPAVCGRNAVGGLVGQSNFATIANCYASGGTVTGQERVGGLIGSSGDGRGWYPNSITDCYATVTVMGDLWVGGLAGSVFETVTGCYAAGIVIGGNHVGGLAGSVGPITNCYAQGVVLGEDYVGGLVGYAQSITNCYATAAVLADWHAGGLVADVGQTAMPWETTDDIVACFWDVQMSRQPTSAGGMGKTTAQMQTLVTFRDWGEGDNAGIWTIDSGNDYPRLAWENRPGTVIGSMAFCDLLKGAGTQDDPYLIYTADEMEVIANEPNEWGKHFKLMADIDLGAYPGVGFNAGSPDYLFSGVFDGNGHTISNFTRVSKWNYPAGFFGWVEDPCVRRTRGNPECDPNAGPVVIKDLGLLNPVVDGREEGLAGALVGCLGSAAVSNCYVEGGLVLGAGEETGGLVGYNGGTLTGCRVVGTIVTGGSATGGLVGLNGGDIAMCYSTGTVTGGWFIGGLVGRNEGGVTNCYSASTVRGTQYVGGLVGYGGGAVRNCYSSGTVTQEKSEDDWAGDATGEESDGGLVGGDYWGEVVASFWDVETSGQDTSAGGTGLTTAEMQTAATFLEAGWDFVGEAANGTDDLWWIDEGQDYPRLWWEASAEALQF